SPQHQSWTDDLPLCQMCGVGTTPNCVYGPDGKGSQSHSNEDGHVRFRGEDGCFLYGVFNGYDGSRVASFASQRLTAELLLGQINSSHTDNDIRRILTQAFDVVEKSYFETIDDALAEKANLHHRCSNYQQQALHCQHWYQPGSAVQVQQRWPEPGSPDRPASYHRQRGRTAETRWSGAAKAKPIISEPEIHSSQSLDNISGFLVLMSEGLVAALEAAHGPEQVNQEIVAMVAAELAQQASIEAAAQSVVDRVKRLHHDVYVSGRQRSVYCSRHEDMTLLIRTINYPLADGGSRPRKVGYQRTLVFISRSVRHPHPIYLTDRKKKKPTACCLVNHQPFIFCLPSSQVAVSTQCQCPTPTAKAPVKPV
ncbi:unnamed protein product, partial [Tetraodon nigroviridis]